VAIRALARSFLPSKARRKAGLLFFRTCIDPELLNLQVPVVLKPRGNDLHRELRETLAVCFGWDWGGALSRPGILKEHLLRRDSMTRK
jgi:hypothetical protein